MALSTSEIESLRHHLGYGNIGALAAPYTPDGFLELFTDVIAPNLSVGTETSATTAITAGATVVVTPVVMTDITAYSTLVVDTGEQSEAVIVKAVTATTFTASFAKSHASSGYPVATMSGTARLRLLLWDADVAWRALSSPGLSATLGLKSVDEVHFFGNGSATLTSKTTHYNTICQAIASLVQVAPRWAGGDNSRLEAY
jgi:hypothetical protein